LTAEEILRARNKERDDLSFIDNASAVLSRGGGMTYSIKSSTLETLSMMTPPASNPSASSSIFGSKYSDSSTKFTNHSARESLKPLKKDLVWQRYKEKNAEAAR
jgi:hypothetical protein